MGVLNFCGPLKDNTLYHAWDCKYRTGESVLNADMSQGSLLMYLYSLLFLGRCWSCSGSHPWAMELVWSTLNRQHEGGKLPKWGRNDIEIEPLAFTFRLDSTIFSKFMIDPWLLFSALNCSSWHFGCTASSYKRYVPFHKRSTVMEKINNEK